MTVKIGIVGTGLRDTEDDYQLVKFHFLNLFSTLNLGPEPSSITVHLISGSSSKGADRFAERIAHKWNIPIRKYRSNKLIAEESDYLIACVSKDRSDWEELTMEFIRRKGESKLTVV